MNYELSIFDKLIAQELNPAAIHGENNVAKFDEYVNHVREETIRIKSSMVSQVFSLETEQHIELYIQNHQTAIINLADVLLSYVNKEQLHLMYVITSDKTLENLHKIMYGALEDVLNYIEKYFTKYFNLDLRVLMVYKLLAVREVDEKLTMIKRNLEGKGIDTRLQETALNPMELFIQSSDKALITFRGVLYIKALQTEMLRITESTNEDLSNRIKSMLIYINYNSFHFFQFMTNTMLIEIESEKSDQDKINKLLLFSKTIAQQHVKPSHIYKHKQPSIKAQLVEWINEEIYYLENKIRLAKKLATTQIDELENFKVNTMLSVSQIAYLTKLFNESGVIKVPNQLALLRLIARFCRTQNMENISSASLRSKYYNTEDSTRLAVKEVLAQLIDQAKS
jgi:hypothetical protein